MENADINPSLKGRFGERGLLAGAIIAVCIAVIWTHWPALSATAMSFDDDEYLSRNIPVQTPGWASAKRFLTEVFEPSTVKGYYQPLTMISLMFDYALGGRDDYLMPFHRTSLILHAANTVLVITLLYLLFGRIWIAMGIGLLFGVHPMTVEPIAWLGERKTLLAAFFALSCLILHVRYVQKNNRPHYIASLVMYLSAVMSKPTAVPVPVLMLLMDIWPLERRGKRIVVEKIPFFAVMFAFAIITYISQERTAGGALAGGYGTDKILSVVCYSVTFYLHKIICPINLTSQYPPEQLELTNPVMAASVIGAVVLIIVLIISLRWTRAIFIGGLFFLIAILPTIQIFRFSFVFTSDKYVYLPVFGLLMILAWFLKWLSMKSTVRVIVVAAILVLATAEMWATRRYLVYWQDTASLCERMLALAPNTGSIHDMLGRALQGQGRSDEAIEHFHKALEISPDATTYSNLGIALAQRGQLDEAVDCFERSVQLNPELAEVYSNLGMAFAAQKKYEQAVNAYREAIKIKPDFIQAYSNLGLALKSQGKFDEAIDCFRKAIDIKKDYAVAYYNLANTLWSLNKPAEAVKYFQEAADLSPRDSIILRGFVDILVRHPDAKIKDTSRAVNLAERAARLTGYKDASILETLAAAYSADGRFKEATETAGKALELASAVGNKEMTDRLENAIKFYKMQSGNR